MTLKDLVATPGEAAANRIVKSLRFSSHETRERLWADVRNAVDDAVAAERAKHEAKTAALIRLWNDPESQ